MSARVGPPRPRSRPSAKQAAPRSRRGFTLVELMVAITGGLFMSVVVFTLAKDGSRFYVREARVADATLASITGFERLRGDLARIAFLSSPNVFRDPKLCGAVVGQPWPAALGSLAGVQITVGGSPAHAALAANGLDPDSILIAGNFSGFDTFPMVGVTPAGTGYTVLLQTRIGPLARAAYNAMTAPAQLAWLGTAFPPGRGLRIVDQSGRVQYAAITGVANAGGPQVTLGALPALNLRARNPTLCGIYARDNGFVNVVNFVRYDIRAPAAIAGFDTTPWDAARTELVRSELNVNLAPLTTEVVSEYAVDLRFGLTVADTLTPGGAGTLLTLAPGTAAIANWAGNITAIGAAAPGPERARSLRVRLSVRSREPDRQETIVGASGGAVALGLYRFRIPNATGPALFARVRTLQTEVALHNQAGLSW